jgi:DNA-3-methyladenine glycosylase II
MAELPDYWADATVHLTVKDQVLGKIIAAHPDVRLRLRKDSFTTLARAIVGQQISVKAADAIWGRVVTALKGKTNRITSVSVLAVSTARLRECGLSQKKVEYMQELAQNFQSKLVTAAKLRRHDDVQVKKTLTAIRGVGPWTAEMYLMFNLWRPDVLPLSDVGLLRAIDLHYSGGEKTSKTKIDQVTAKWKPYSTVAVWYLWRSLDPYPVEY